MSSSRKTALVAGVLFLITFVASIPALILYGPVLHHANYIVGAGADIRVRFGALLEIFLAIAGIGTAVTLFPILKRQNESVALGYVASRVLESTIIVVGLISLLSVVTLRQKYAGVSGADSASLIIAGRSLVAFHNWTFLLGPAFCAGFGNGILLGYLMYRSGLVSRRMTYLGPIGGPLVFASAIATLFGAYTQTSKWSGLATVPEFLWSCRLASGSQSKDSGRLRSCRRMPAPFRRRPDPWAGAPGHVGCQWPSVSPQVRPSVLPTGGHVFSPLVAMSSPHDLVGDKRPSSRSYAYSCSPTIRLCGPPCTDRASYTTHLNPRGHKPRVPMIAFADQDLLGLCRVPSYAEGPSGSLSGGGDRLEILGIIGRLTWKRSPDASTLRRRTPRSSRGAAGRLRPVLRHLAV